MKGGEIMGFSINIPLYKRDEERRLVWGRATREELDKANEIMDYASSKPNFEAWSNDFATRTGGKSYGNCRLQHDSHTAIGKIVEPLSFNDEDKAIDVCVKVVDDKAWELVKSSVLTGFSVGGSYGSRWQDDEGITHYTAVPSEISLCDNPCVGSATIECIKADGTTETISLKKEDKPMEDLTKVNDEVKQCFTEALAKADTKKAFSFEEITNRLMGALKAQITTPFNAGYFWIKKTYPDSVIICGDLDGDGDKDCYRVGYKMDADGIITLGKIEAVRAVWIPAIDEDNPEQEFGLPKAHKADEATDLQKAEESEGLSKADEVEETEKADEPAEAVEKTAEAEAPKQEEAPVEKADSVEKTSVEIDSKQEDKDEEEVEKSAEVEKDVFELCSKAMDNADDSTKEKCSKLFHKIVEKGLYCKCDKCSKAVEENKAEKAASDTDLHKAVETEAELAKADSENELAKAMSVIEDLKKGFEAFKSANEALEKRVKELEDMPVAGGAMVANGTMALDKTIGGSVGNPPAETNSEADVLRKMIAEADNAVLKEAYSKKLANLEMKKVFG